ncbi:hypothetical protein D1B31_08805 [Neobacillus notoginsengisoli]|uniref:YqfQ-like protein n=1 Tax=Neobacillus notoginsengisoli TaxID=1578198 RepID=A0A417YUQ6_9BACI|nr:VrrA/YqfQ family protein [Neobacillus notoginsengisoli]RHW41036.1 hypothetical protein D1B31_08805 [Neobacillus notoginsengisoli]
MPPMPQMRRPGFGRQPMGPRFARQSGFPVPQRGPFMGPMNAIPGQPSRGGGLLAKLFGRAAGGNQGAVARSAQSVIGGGEGAGSLLKSLGNPDTINSFLTNTQNVINTAQKFGPLFEQYGPLIKNLPSMWKLYRGMKSSDDQTKTENESSKKGKTAGNIVKEKRTDRKDQVQPVRKTESTPQKNRSSREGNGESKPKLFI